MTKCFFFSTNENIALDNWRVQNEVADRRTVDATAFRDAGARKPKKTFKHDPTKPKASLR